MKKLTYSFLLLMLLTSVPALADYAPVNVQTALKKMYPAAKDVAWSRDETYYVADFIQNGFDTKVWFNSKYKTQNKLSVNYKTFCTDFTSINIKQNVNLEYKNKYFYICN